MPKSVLSSLALIGAGALTVAGGHAPSAQADEPAACAVASAAFGFDEARAAYDLACAGIPRRDCDPMPGGGWHCSSEVIGASAPPASAIVASVDALAIVPEPAVVERSEPEPEPEPEPGAASPADGTSACEVRSLGDLQGCLARDDADTRIAVRADLSCRDAACCPGGGALLRRSGGGSLTIDGNGHRLLREDGHRQCSLLDFESVSDVRITDWHLDDDASVSGCSVEDSCPRMLHVRASRDVTFDAVTVSSSKGYAIYIDGVDGFAFLDSTLQDAGVLGLYIGHDDRASRRVRVERSRFFRNQTNGVALLGVEGASSDDNRIADNVFDNNHWRGQWPVSPRYGTGVTGGGQLYIAQASGVTVSGNRFSDGRCENCFVTQTLGSGISGIELGIPDRRTVSDLRIVDNLISDQDAFGIFVNRGSPLDASVVVSDNLLLGNGIPFSLDGASVSGNTTER